MLPEELKVNVASLRSNVFLDVFLDASTILCCRINPHILSAWKRAFILHTVVVLGSREISWDSI